MQIANKAKFPNAEWAISQLIVGRKMIGTNRSLNILEVGSDDEDGRLVAIVNPGEDTLFAVPLQSLIKMAQPGDLTFYDLSEPEPA
jgi:hypothetical protein